jgi:hypothetical protein
MNASTWWESLSDARRAKLKEKHFPKLKTIDQVTKTMMQIIFAREKS